MAARTPIKLDGSNLKEMSSTDYNNIVARTAYLYMTDQSVALSQVGSSGSLDSMSDTRTQAGASSSDVTNFHTEGETADVSTVTVTYDKITETHASLSAPADTNNIRFPAYIDGNNIKAMTLQEMYDTYVSAATDSLIASQPYKIHTSTSPPSGYTLVSSTAVFTDTRANAAAYTAGGIGETQDQPTDIANYYLHRNNGSSVAYSATPMYIDASQNLKEYTSAEFDAIMKEVIRYTTVNSADSCRLRYYIGGSGTNMGSGMVNTKLNSSTYQQRYVNTDDYRTQEFPAGSAATISTYYLKARKY
jgi:hypothetical protein